MSAILGTSADWYLMRASGFVALILMTVTLGLGVSNLARLAKGRWTRTVAALVHRNVSLLAVVFLGVHILTAISDKYVQVPALSLLVPGLSKYDPFWVGLGALSLDLTLAVVVTSLLRSRLRQRTWRVVHWLAYLSWPSAMLHSIGSGSGTGADTGAGWSTFIYLICAGAFGAAVAARVWLSGQPRIAGAPARPASRYPVLATVPAARARTPSYPSRRTS